MSNAFFTSKNNVLSYSVCTILWNCLWSKAIYITLSVYLSVVSLFLCCADYGQFVICTLLLFWSFCSILYALYYKTVYKLKLIYDCLQACIITILVLRCLWTFFFLFWSFSSILYALYYETVYKRKLYIWLYLSTGLWYHYFCFAPFMDSLS